MTKKSFISIILTFCIAISCKQASIEYPVTRKVDSTDIYFGQQVSDPYRWLEDDHSDETKAWVKSQNEITFSYLQKIPFRNKVQQRLSELWNYERQTMLKKESGIYYFEGNTGLQNQNILYYKKSISDEPKVLLDPNTLSEDGTAAINKVAISADGRYLAYAISKSGSDWAEIFVKEIESGKILPDHLKWVKFSNISWDRNGFFYSRYDEPKGKELTGKNEFHKLYYHQLGSEQKNDVLVIKHDTDPGVTFNAEVTDDRKYLIISENKGFDGNKLIIQDIASKKNLKFLGSDYLTEYNFIGNFGSSFYLITSEGAPKRKIVRLEITGKGEISTIVPEKEYVLRGADLNGENRIVAHYMKDAQSRLELFDNSGKYLKEIALPSPGAVTDLSSKAGSEEVLFTFTSFTYPLASYIHDIKSESTSSFFTPKLEFNPEDYTTSRKFSAFAARRIAAIRRSKGTSRHTVSSLPGCWRNTAT
jgi:prolyl oligopeptidase